MQTNMRGLDMITTQEWTKGQLDTVMDIAFDLKKKRALGIPHPYLRDKTLAMLFFFSSTRTRGSFEAGMAQLGGHAAFVESRTAQIAHGDTAKELGEIYGRYFDGIAIRHVDWGVGNKYLRYVAEASRAPVLNMQCDLYHPHQALADLQTIIEHKGNPRGKTITVSWAYASSYQKPLSVPTSLILLMTRYGMNVRLVHPPKFDLPQFIVDQARENAKQSGGSLELMDDFDAGFKDSDVIYAKSWGPLVYTTDPEESKRLIDQYKDWITDARRMALAKPDAIYMHPLPADRDIEVTTEVLEGPQSVVYDEAENRLHVQKAVMALTMGSGW